MNHVPPRNQDAETVALAQKIVAQHAFPPQVTEFHVALGEFDGDPALWITFDTLGGWIADSREREQDAAILNDLVRRVRPSLIHAFPDRFPYFRFSTAATTGSAPT